MSMKFSTKAEYGLRALVHLVKAEKPVSLAQIAKQERLSLPYLERLFSVLKKEDIVKSYKGVSGGYALTRPANKISVAEVIKALEGSVYDLQCVGCKVCGCVVNPVWQKLYEQIDKTLSQMSLASLVK